MTLLPVKLLLAPSLVGAASLVGRRFGPRAGGVAASLPIVAGPALLFFALEQGAAFGATAARSTLVGLVPLTVFCLVHAHLARALRLPRRFAVPLCLAGGWTAFLACAALLRPIVVPAWAAPLAGGAALLAGLLLVPDVPADGAAPKRRHHPALELALRMLAAAALVTGLSALADRLGPTWSGLLTPFPVASSVVLAGTHLVDGPEHLAGMLRGFLTGLYGFVAFLIALAFGLAPLGIGPAFVLGLGASVAISAFAARQSRAAGVVGGG